MGRLQEIQMGQGLAPTGKPGEWAKQGGIDMNRINLGAIAIGQEQPKTETPSPVRRDGADLSGIFAFLRRNNPRNRLERILEGDRRAIGRQAELESEAKQLVEDMEQDPGLRREVEGVVRRLPVEEQAYVARLLREKGDPAKQIVKNVDAVRRADVVRTQLLESGYEPIGGGLGDSMVVTGDGVQIFVAGMGNGDRDTTPDDSFPFDAVVNGRLKFEVAGRNENGRRASKRRWGVFLETVRATDIVTGKTYELRGVRNPDDVLDNLYQAAQTITEGEQAARDTMQLLRDHPEMLE